jgi:hypothetical protein
MTNFRPSEGSIVRLNLEIAAILNPKDSRAYSFKAYVKNRIRQFHLKEHLNPNEVINEAYKRAIAAVEAGKEIQNWQAWLKTTCFNIIRERSRANKKCSSVDPQSLILANLQACDAINVFNSKEEATAHEVEKQLMILEQALEELARTEFEDFQLLKLRLIDELSWASIRDYLLKNTDQDVPNLTTLRQRAVRAKRKLRRLYHRIEDATVSK